MGLGWVWVRVWVGVREPVHAIEDIRHADAPHAHAEEVDGLVLELGMVARA